MSDKSTVNIENNIMEKVLSGQVKMRPKLYFILGSLLSFAGLVGAFVSSAFLFNLTLFLIRKQGPGTGKLIRMFETFPIWVPILAVAFVLVGIWLLHRYDFSYKQNFIALIIVVIIAVVMAGVIIDAFGLNDIWSKRGPMRRFYVTDNSYTSRRFNMELTNEKWWEGWESNPHSRFFRPVH